MTEPDSETEHHELGRKLLDDPETVAWLYHHVQGTPRAVTHVQSLWSGYGEIVRVELAGAAVPSVIVKWVEPPQVLDPPRGWSGRASHERKLRSYEVEQHFYADWIARPRASHRTAGCIAAESTDHGWRFLLEDLDASGFGRRSRNPNSKQLDHCLRWLASFHAHFLGRPPTGLWEIGTYWHLDTRSEEFQAMVDPQLLEAAPLLDAALSRCQFQTLVHGDAKLANFCFGEDDVAAVDFQYVGGGCGIKDVVYLLSSCLTDSDCEREAPRHLDTYFSFLRQFLDPAIDADAVVAEWHALYPAAWADFHRFLAGWAPGHWKIHRYTREMTRLAMSRL